MGLAGLAGAGRTEVIETIFGIATKKEGTIKLNGKTIKNRNASESIKNGFALLTEERRANGIFPSLSIEANTTISSLKDYKKSFYTDNSLIKQVTNETIQKLKIKTADSKSKIKTLSGGNQQNVILGRWLLTKPEILLLDEPNIPTRVSGGLQVAPMSRQILSDVLPYMGIEPTLSVEELLKSEVNVPNVVNMSVDEARNTLKNSKLSMSSIGVIRLSYIIVPIPLLILSKSFFKNLTALLLFPPKT